jgi:cell division septal protein FtsQ
MWYKERTPRRRFRFWRRNSGESERLQVKTRLLSREVFAPGRMAVFLLLSVGVAAAMGLLWVGVRAAGRAAFSRNPRFTLRHLEIRSGGDLVEGYIRGGRGITEGSNLFAFDPVDVRRLFLKQGAGFRSMTLTRRLPDTLWVDVEERVPLARIGEAGRLVVDEEGVVFARRAGAGALPAITGLRDSPLPGATVSGLTRAALQVLDGCKDPRLGLRVEAIDVSRDDCLVLRCGGGRPVRFSWLGMSEPSPESRRAMLRKLVRLSRTLSSPESARHEGFDATYGDMIVGQ